MKTTLSSVISSYRQLAYKTVVIKLGGEAIRSAALKRIAQEICQLAFWGVNPLVVFGAGPQFDDELRKAKMPVPPKKGGVRITPPETIPYLKRACLNISWQLESALNSAHVGIFHPHFVTILPKEICANVIGKEYGLTGKAIAYFNSLAEKERRPAEKRFALVPPLARSQDVILNVNADDVARVCAVATLAKRIIFITGGVSGVIGDGNVIERLSLETAQNLLKRKVIVGGMACKVNSAVGAIKCGVDACHIIGTRASIIKTLFSGIKPGTTIIKPAPE
jgi:acetylglutamate kinase